MKIAYLIYLKSPVDDISWLESHWPSLLRIPKVLSKDHQIRVFLRGEKDGQTHFNSNLIVHWVGDNLPPNLRMFHRVGRLHKTVKAFQPDIIHVHGMAFPSQILFSGLPKHKVVLQHHADLPLGGFRKQLQKRAFRHCWSFFVSSDLFTPWRGILDEKKAQYVMEDGPDLKSEPGTDPSFQKGAPHLLWVGRLNQNKDPITVLKGILNLLERAPKLRTSFIYQTDELLEEMKQLIPSDLNHHFDFVGKLPQAELASYYQHSDYFVSGSLSEGSGYALLESLSFGCIPVVTQIPAFQTITKQGQVGTLWPVKDHQAFSQSFPDLSAEAIKTEKNKTMQFFQENWSPTQVAKQWENAYQHILKYQ